MSKLDYDRDLMEISKFKNRLSEKDIDSFRKCSFKKDFLRKNIENFVYPAFMDQENDILDEFPNKFFLDNILNKTVETIISKFDNVKLFNKFEKNYIKKDSYLNIMSKSCYYGSTNLVKYIYKIKSINFNFINGIEKSIDGKNMDIINFFVEKIRAKSTNVAKDILEAMKYVCYHGDYNIFEMFYYFNIPETNYFAILNFLILFSREDSHNGYLKCIKLIMPHIDQKILENNIMLIYNIKNDDIFYYIIENININAADTKGNTLLMLYYKNRHQRAKYLFEITDLNVQNEQGETVFHEAIRHNDLKVFQTYFIDDKVNKKLKNVKGESYLYYAINNKHKEVKKILEILLIYLDVNEKSNKKSTSVSFTPLLKSAKNYCKYNSMKFFVDLFLATDFSVHYELNGKFLPISFFLFNYYHPKVAERSCMSIKFLNDKQKNILIPQINSIFCSIKNAQVCIEIIKNFKYLDLNEVENGETALAYRLKNFIDDDSVYWEIYHFVRDNNIKILNVKTGEKNQTPLDIAQEVKNFNAVSIFKKFY